MSEVPEQIESAAAVIECAIPADALLSIHIYGSFVTAGLRPDSDLDLLVVTGRRLEHPEKRALVDGLLPISGMTPAVDELRPLEVTVVARPDVVPWRYPPAMDLQFGEWLRGELADPDAPLDTRDAPDLAIILSMARGTEKTITGAGLADLVSPVPAHDLRQAMIDELPSLLDELEDDTRNVLLTLARVRATMATGRIESKADAASQAIDQLPPAEAAVMMRARELYVDGGFGPWDDLYTVQRTADLLVEAIESP